MVFPEKLLFRSIYYELLMVEISIRFTVHVSKETVNNVSTAYLNFHMNLKSVLVTFTIALISRVFQNEGSYTGLLHYLNMFVV